MFKQLPETFSVFSTFAPSITPSEVFGYMPSGAEVVLVVQDQEKGSPEMVDIFSQNAELQEFVKKVTLPSKKLQ